MGIYAKICAKCTQIEYGRYVDILGNLLHEEQGEKFGFRLDDEVEILRGDLVEILMETIKDMWVSKSFLSENEVSKETAEEGLNTAIKMIIDVSNGIILPDYEK